MEIVADPYDNFTDNPCKPCTRCCKNCSLRRGCFVVAIALLAASSLPLMSFISDDVLKLWETPKRQCESDMSRSTNSSKGEVSGKCKDFDRCKMNRLAKNVTAALACVFGLSASGSLLVAIFKRVATGALASSILILWKLILDMCAVSLEGHIISQPGWASISELDVQLRLGEISFYTILLCLLLTYLSLCSFAFYHQIQREELELRKSTFEDSQSVSASASALQLSIQPSVTLHPLTSQSDTATLL